jgi:hypothetical protein
MQCKQGGSRRKKWRKADTTGVKNWTLRCTYKGELMSIMVPCLPLMFASWNARISNGFILYVDLMDSFGVCNSFHE